jgi:hypothetical protein
VGASIVFASPATTLSGPGMAAASRRVVSCSATPCSGPDRLRNLGYLVHHGEQVREPIGMGIRADLDGVVDTSGLPGCNVEPARRGHADPVQFDVQCVYGTGG